MNRHPQQDQQRRSRESQRPQSGTGTKRILPAYEEVQLFCRRRPLTSAKTANTGLVYDRYVDVWSELPTWKPAQRQFLNGIAQRAHDGAVHIAPLLESLHARRAGLWEAMGACVVEVSLTAPLVSGLGMMHPLEVGFVWDRNLGIPYLPATSLKGVARAWAEQWDAGDKATVQRIFGDAADTPDAGTGSVVFHALYPLNPPPLRVDVLNPHFADYYQKGKPPGDWLEPIPIFFLTVPAGQVFRTAIHPRPHAGPDDLDQAERWLCDALATLGVGAKTAVGYGLFAPSEVQ